MSCSIEDIEDMNFSNDDKRIKKNKISLNFKNTSKKNKPSDIIPGTQNIYIKTWGCPHNLSDSQYMHGILADYGYNISDNQKDANDADLWILNSCTVKGPSEKNFIKEINNGKSKDKKLILAGCVPQGDRHNQKIQGYSIIGVQQIDRIVEVVEQTLRGNTVKLLAKNRKPSLDLPKIRNRNLTEIIPISKGCMGSCTFCKTKHARGSVGSYSKEAIVNRIKKVIDEGITQIDLESEDSGAYGLDINSNLPELLQEIINNIPKDKDIMIKFGMTNPPYILNHLESIAKFLNHPNVFSYLHIPVQSGNNRILEKMNREYTIEEYKMVVDYMYKNVPNITIQTDIIVGFPTETEDEFNDSLRLVRDYKFKFIHISKFYPRPGTVAAKFPMLDPIVINNRSKKLTELYKSYLPNHHFLGNYVQVYVTNQKSKYNDMCVTHDKYYNQIIIPKNNNKNGKKIWIKIIDVKRFHMKGRLLYNYELFFFLYLYPLILFFYNLFQ